MSTQAQALDSEAGVSPAPKPGIVWIASFPKSGNTWARTFLHNLARIQSGEEGEQDINAMHRFSTWDLSKKYYAEVLGFTPRNDQRAEIAAARPKVHELIADRVDGGATFIKTHNALVIDRG